MFINEYKSFEISNQKIFNVMITFFQNKRQTDYDINIAKQNYLVAPFRRVCLMSQRHI